MSTPASTLRYADRYRVLRRLGAGGMATVFLAEDERLGRQVALKRLHADSPEDMARRFDREARLGASLNHPNLVTVFDTVVDPEGVLIVMEYVDGPSLAAALKDGPLAHDRALAVVREVAAALDQAHGQGIVHRDVKPANILLAERGQAKLADLGIAFAAEGATHITRTGTVLGTPSYMAPEQLEGREVGPAVDVYALATVAFEAISGRKARTGGSPLEIAHRIATEAAPDLREAWAEAPPGASQVLCEGMAFDPSKRPGSAGELAERLEAELGGEARGSTEASRRVGRSAAPAAGAAAAAGALAPDGGEEGTVERPADGVSDARGEDALATASDAEGDGSVRDDAADIEDAPDAEMPAASPEASPADSAASDASAPIPSAEDPAPTPSAEQPAPAPSAEEPAPAQHAEHPAPAPHAEDTASAPGKQPAPAPAPPRPSTRRRPRPAWLAPVALLLVIAAAAIGGVIAMGGAGGGATDGEPQTPQTEGDGSEGSGEAAGGGAATSPSGDPRQTVTSFYERAAAGDYQGAWALAGPGFRSQLGSFESFRGGVDTLESIEFEQADVSSQQGDSAEVAIRTVATHSDGVDRCRGSLSVARDGANGWLIDRANISCPSSTRG